MESPFKIPFYIRASLVIIGLYFFIDILYIARGIIIPVVVATIIAVVLRQVVNFLVRKKMKRLLAIVLTVLTAVSVTLVLGALVVSQAVNFSESLPNIINRLHELLNEMVTWSSAYFNISVQDINAWLVKAKGNFLSNNGPALRNTLSGLSGVLVIFLLAPFYVFMILYYQPLLLGFVYKITGTENNQPV